MLTYRFDTVFTFVPDLSGAKGAATKIVQLFDREIEIDAESPAGKQVQNLEGSIVFKKCVLSYG
jgi:ATP-binding cassette subfamily B (MDR/TAP) protein 1